LGNHVICAKPKYARS